MPNLPIKPTYTFKELAKFTLTANRVELAVISSLLNDERELYSNVQLHDLLILYDIRDKALRNSL